MTRTPLTEEMNEVLNAMNAERDAHALKVATANANIRRYLDICASALNLPEGDAVRFDHMQRAFIVDTPTE